MNLKHLLFLYVALIIGGILACGSKTEMTDDQDFFRPPLEEKSKETDEPDQPNSQNLDGSVANDDLQTPQQESPIAYLSEEDILNQIGIGQKQNDLVCRHHRTTRPNAVIKAFCINGANPKNIRELQQALGLSIINEGLTRREQNGTGGNPAFALLGHSTSLVGRLVNGLNPRAIVFTPPDQLTPSNLDFVMMSFVRGDQLIELAAFDGQSKSLEFYLLRFKQSCNQKKGGCSFGELMTPALENDWTDTTLYSMEQLTDTILDCTHCHQPHGPTAPRSLRMQELETPWTHWLSDDTQGLALINDYYAMHGRSEIYAGIPGPMIGASRPELLDKFIKKTGFISAQINDFKSKIIESEIVNNNPRQPVDNTLPGVSATWQGQYDQSKTSYLPPIPYHDLKVTEFGPASKAVEEYQTYLQKRISASDLTKYRDLFKIDQNQRARMGFAIEREAGPYEILQRACGQCHNSRLDQGLSKSRFNVALEQIKDRDNVLETAIKRLKLGYSPERLKALNINFVLEKDPKENPVNSGLKSDKNPTTHLQVERSSHALTMPPARFRQLTDDQIDLLIQYLASQKTKK